MYRRDNGFSSREEIVNALRETMQIKDDEDDSKEVIYVKNNNGLIINRDDSMLRTEEDILEEKAAKIDEELSLRKMSEEELFAKLRAQKK